MSDVNQIKKIIVKQLIGEINESEKRILEVWLARSEENRTVFERLTAGDFVGHAIADNNRETRHKVWQQIDQLTLKKRQIVIHRRFIRIAAAVIIFLGIGLFYMIRKEADVPEALLAEKHILPGKSKAILELANGNKIVLDGDTTFQMMGIIMVNRKDTLDIVKSEQVLQNAGEYHTIRVPKGAEYVAKLGEGTVVHLNAGSELRMPVVFGSKSRMVYFVGEGYFSVARDTNRPFIVHTQDVDIRVLGTEFGIRSYDSEKEIITTLVKGCVEVKQELSHCYLAPKEQARVNKRGKISVAQVNVYQYVAWTTGRMVFENERLEDIMNELSRWYDVTVFFSRPELKDLRFTMDIKKYSDLKEFTTLMEKMEKVSFRIKDRTVVIE